MINEVNRYVTYLRAPGMKFMTISEFNAKFQTDIAPNSALEESIKKARIEIGPNDVLVQSFSLAPEPRKVRKLINVEPMDVNMDDLLEEEEVEDEYEQACDDCGKSHTNSCVGNKAKEKNIKDATTLKHLVGFQGNDMQLMKGKERYIKSLRAYADGDQSAEIRMFDGKKMLVSELNPNKQSLKELFAAFPSGPHTVICD